VKRTWLSAIGLVLLAAACSKGTEATDVKTKKDAGAAPPAAAAPMADVEFQADIVAPEEAKAEAEAAITEDNADEEFEKLKKEIESGG
jgi:hypothetical protein